MFLDYFAYYLYNILTFFAIYLIIAKKDYVKNHKREIIVGLVVALLYSQYRRYGARLFTPAYSYPIDSIPIHFCRFSALMTLFYLITKNKILKGFVYFQAGLGVLSVLIPGGYFFIMTQEWRSYTYMVDHAILAIMPFFIVFIDGYNVNKRDFLISLLYSVFVPLLVLPIAITTNYNAYYVLDGVFIKDIVGDNQFAISSLLAIALILYNILMWYAAKGMQKWREKDNEQSSNLFQPLYPWIGISAFVIIGVFISFFFVRPVPSYLENYSHQRRPIASYGEDIIVYKAFDDNEDVYYFFEPLHGGTIELYEQDGTPVVVQTTTNQEAFYFNTSTVDYDQLIIVLVHNEGEVDETIKVFDSTIQLQINE